MGEGPEAELRKSKEARQCGQDEREERKTWVGTVPGGPCQPLERFCLVLRNWKPLEGLVTPSQ